MQAHLYLDHILNDLISEELKNPNALGIDRMSFSQKLQLVDAMGLLGNATIAAIRHLNKVRNDIAHKFDFQLTDKEVKKIISTTAKFLRVIIKEEPNRNEGPVTFFEVLHVLTLHCEVSRTKLKERRELEKKSLL